MELMLGTGPSRRETRYNLFDGFVQSEEFKYYLRTLAEW